MGFAAPPDFAAGLEAPPYFGAALASPPDLVDGFPYPVAALAPAAGFPEDPPAGGLPAFLASSGFLSSSGSSGSTVDITPAAIVLPPSLKANLNPVATGKGKFNFNLQVK